MNPRLNGDLIDALYAATPVRVVVVSCDASKKENARQRLYSGATRTSLPEDWTTFVQYGHVLVNYYWPASQHLLSASTFCIVGSK